MPDCNWFTFSSYKDFCQLFKNCLIIDSDICPDCKSGHKNCLDKEPKCGVKGECQGVTIEHEEIVLFSEECHKLCKKTSGCEWFTFYKDISQCSLFETCTIVNCNNCNSGEISCDNIKSGQSQFYCNYTATCKRPAIQGQNSQNFLRQIC